MINSYFLFKNIPSIDLHGENKESAIILLNEFICDNIMLKNSIIKVVHGKGEYILKNAVHSFLKTNKYVKSYKTDMFNSGVTIVEIKK